MQDSNQYMSASKHDIENQRPHSAFLDAPHEKVQAMLPKLLNLKPYLNRPEPTAL